MTYPYEYSVNDPAGALYLITAPSQAVVSVEDMKAHLRVDFDEDDPVIEALTEAATAHLDGADGKLRRALVSQTWEWRLSWFPGCDFIRIPLAPLIEIVSVKYIDEDDTEQTVDAGDYHVFGVGDRGKIQLRASKTWPTLGAGWPEPVIIRYRAGYVDTGNSPPTGVVPAPIVAAIKLLTANLYENRQTIIIGQSAIELPWAAEALLQPYRVYD